ncbi:hypothetical protein D3C72_1073730 [compost metagenome]
MNGSAHQPRRPRTNVMLPPTFDRTAPSDGHSPLEVILAKRAHITRMANQSGAAGEQNAIQVHELWVPRPRGKELKILMEALAKSGFSIRASSFDALALPHAIDLADAEQVRLRLPEITFIEIKTARQKRVRPGFDGFFFALTEREIEASEQLGKRHKVALFNTLTEEILLTSVDEIIKRSRSMNWQLSVQL